MTTLPFIPKSERPSCEVCLVGEHVLILLAYTEGKSNGFIRRVDLPCAPEEIGAAALETLAQCGQPWRDQSAEPPPYVVLAGEKNERAFHKKTSLLNLTWFKRPHQAGPLTWVPGISLGAWRRERRSGAFTGASDIPGVQGIRPTDPARIGREVLAMFALICERYDG